VVGETDSELWKAADIPFPATRVGDLMETRGRRGRLGKSLTPSTRIPFAEDLSNVPRIGSGQVLERMRAIPVFHSELIRWICHDRPNTRHTAHGSVRRSGRFRRQSGLRRKSGRQRRGLGHRSSSPECISIQERRRFLFPIPFSPSPLIISASVFAEDRGPAP